MQTNPATARRTTAKNVRGAISRTGRRYSNYLVSQEGDQVRITCTLAEPVQGYTLEMTHDTQLTELAHALSVLRKGQGGFLCTPIRSQDENLVKSLIVTLADQEPDLSKDILLEDTGDGAAFARYMSNPEYVAKLVRELTPARCPEFAATPIAALDPHTIGQLKLAAEAAIDLTPGLGFHKPAQLKLDPAYLNKVALRISDVGHIHISEDDEEKGKAYLAVSQLLRMLAQALPGYTPGIFAMDLLSTLTWDLVRTRLTSIAETIATPDDCNQVFPRLYAELNTLRWQVPALKESR